MKVLLVCCALIQIVNLLAAFNLKASNPQEALVLHVPRAFSRSSRGAISRLSLNSGPRIGRTERLFVGCASYARGDLESRLFGNENSFSFNFNDRIRDSDAAAESVPSSASDCSANVAVSKLSDGPTSALAEKASNTEDADGAANLPLATIEEFRARFGTAKSIWGDWSPPATRKFYKEHLPKSLLGTCVMLIKSLVSRMFSVDGIWNLTLEERAKLAATSRHALRMYTRERCRYS
jgi:hypothetical protein